MKIPYTKLLIALAIGMSFVACAKKDDPIPDTAAAIPAQPPGQFQSQGPVATENMQRFDQGCEVKGKPSAKKKIDERLHPGDAYLYNEIESFESKKRTIRRKELIEDVTPTFLQVTGKINVHSTSGGMGGLNGAPYYTRVCTTEAGTAEGSADVLRCHTRPNATVGVERYCTVSETGEGDWQTKVVAGTYKIGSSRSVQGYKITRTGTGTVSCGPEMKVIGSGKMTSMELVSNEVPSPRENYCGGVQIFSHIEVYNERNSRIYSFQTKLESLDWRNQ